MDLPAENAKHATVLDVTAQQIARVYAQAFLGACDKTGRLEEIIEETRRLIGPPADEVLAEIEKREYNY